MALTESDLSRRALGAAALSAGFALAVQPIRAETVVATPADGLTAGMVKVPAADGVALDAYRAVPSEGGARPVVLVVQEIFGLHEHIQDVVRRFAKAGYYAISAQLYQRQGDVAGLGSIDEIRAVVMRVPDAQVMADLDAQLRFAAGDGGRADPTRAAVTGFCWGGRITWLYAAHNPELKAGVAWYGRLTGERTGLHPRHAVDVAGELKAPVLGLYGGQDQGIPLDTVEAMRAALAAAGKTDSEIHVYAEGPHGFYADYRPSYRPEMASDAWGRCLAWFRTHGVG